MMKYRVVSTLAILFALTAAFLSYKLLIKHNTGTSESGWFEAGCNESDETQSGCSAVLASPYSVWPPKKKDEPANTPHVPVAFAGLVYYSVVAVWLIGVGGPSRERRWIHLLPVGVVGLGLCGSIYFVYIMATVIDEWCPWCMVTHGLNLGLAICVFLLWPRKRAACDGKKKEAAKSPAPSTPAQVHPSARLVVVTLLAVVLIAVAEDKTFGKRKCLRYAESAKRSYRQCMQALGQFQRNPSVLAKTWEGNTVHQIAVRSDDPVRRLRPDQPDPLALVVFSDFACPSCKRLATFLEQNVAPLFGGNLQIVFKHFPLNSECNPMTTTRMHTHACTGARLAEAARLVGGNDGFWRAHDYLFEHQDYLTTGKLTTEMVADAVGLDRGLIAQAMASDAVAQRIRQDAQAGRSYELTGTPSLYLRGRRVDPVIRNELRFWDKIAGEYWQNRNVPRPESTELRVKPATQGSPGQPAVP